MGAETKKKHVQLITMNDPHDSLAVSSNSDSCLKLKTETL